MGQLIVQVSFAVGFLMTWLGFACLMLPIALRYVFGGPWLDSLSMPWSERYARAGEFMSKEIARAGSSRLGRAGQILVATGSSFLMFSGALWLALRIIERQG